MSGFFFSYVDEVLAGLRAARVTTGDGGAPGMEEAVSLWVERAKAVRDGEGLIFFCGNGASATMAEHMSHDWFQNARVNTTTCAETAHITAISNDLSFDEVFSYRIRRILSLRDMLVAISSSGNSPNIIKAVEAGKEKGAYCVTLSGKGEGNAISRMGDLNFYVPLPTYGLVESAHALLLHGALDCFLERYMGGKH